MAYATLAQLKDYLKSPDATNDALLTDILARAIAAVDNYTATVRSTFVSFEQVGQTRYFHGEGSSHLFVPDLLSVTSIALDTNRDGTFATTLAPSGYWLPDETPINLIELPPFANWTTWPKGRRTVRIQGQWGYAVTAPADVVEAVLETAVRIFQGRALGFGDAIGVDAGGESLGGGGVLFTKAQSSFAKQILNGYRGLLAFA